MFNYKFILSINDCSVEGFVETEAENVNDAYNKANKMVQEKLKEAFPFLSFNYRLEPYFDRPYVVYKVIGDTMFSIDDAHSTVGNIIKKANEICKVFENNLSNIEWDLSKTYLKPGTLQRQVELNVKGFYFVYLDDYSKDVSYLRELGEKNISLVDFGLKNVKYELIDVCM